ncbi:MAG: DUF1016 family protein [Bacilli bacterium]|nr:DUF1016 family protein [Bacilli bacterium]
MLEQDFKNILLNIKNEIKTSQIKTMFEVNKNLIMLYFKLGKIISENSEYGKSFIKNVSTELKLEFPNMKGFSERNLNYMKLFYEEYKDDENLQQLVANLPWGHNLLLIQKFKDKEIRRIYAEATLENGWSRNILSFQIDGKYHLRVGNSTNNFSNTLPSPDSDLVNNVIKDPYIFDFITLRDGYKEKALEMAMINRIRDVLLELGNGFSFVGNQYKLTVGNDDYYIDLLFYHLKLRCYVVVELKANSFKPEYAGKMNFYLNAVNDMLKNETDNPSIGLILCQEKDKLTAQYSLKGIDQPIGVSSYEITKFLPEDISKELPTEEDINLHIDIEE